MTTNPVLNKFAERLAKATPEELLTFAERLAKRADCIKAAKEHLAKAMEHHEKLVDHLDNLKDHADDLEEKAKASKDAGTGTLQKDTENAASAVKALYTGLKGASDGIGEEHDLISGSIEEYEDEAEEQVAAGLAAEAKHPDAGTQKMVKALQRENKAILKAMEKMQRQNAAQLEAVVTGLTNGLAKGLENSQPRVEQPTPVRTVFTVEKSADGSGNVVRIPGSGQPAIVASSVSPVLSDGVTPNPDFTKLAEAQGEAAQKALRSATPQSGNPFVGIEALVSKASA